jgi:hypothetical protein
MPSKNSLSGGRQDPAPRRKLLVEDGRGPRGTEAVQTVTTRFQTGPTTEVETEGIEMTTVTGFQTRSITKVDKGGDSSRPLAYPPRRVRAAGYVRQEFSEVGKKGISPEGQKARIAACADAHEWHLVETYEDVGWTGNCLSRPGLIALLANPDFEVLIIDRTDCLTCKKSDLDFLLALLEKHNITCVPATWTWEPLAQYMRWWYRRKANPVYAALDAATAKS